MSKRELTAITTDLNEKQLLRILQRTPDNHVYTRPAKGGGSWDYVTGVYVKKVLNFVFGWNWDFEVKNHGVEGDLVWVLGRLTVRTGDMTIVKEQFGRADCKKKKDGSGYLDFGNDLKAATTDALKKCASELGIASDIYGKNEFKEIEKVQVNDEMGDLTKPEKQTGKKLPPPVETEKPVISQEMDIVAIRQSLKNGN